MSAWKKQAVPLVFLEIGMNAIIAANPTSPSIRRIAARVDRWVDAAWQPLRERSGRIDDTQATKVTVKAATAVQAHLQRMWADGGIKTPVELPTAMLVIAEDVRQQLPRKDKGRTRAWGYLTTALYELCQVADPDLSDREGADRGIGIAEVVMMEAA